jgi:D-cysteine desulfhydrase family pyridoxal phosphate-dependent enzyme
MKPRLKIAHLPTPVETLPHLSTKFKGPTLITKRDDQTGLAFGGNKTRKLEFLLYEAQAAGADTLLTAGAVQSNHCRQTVAAAARLGLKCTLVLFGDPPHLPDGNHFLFHLFGAELIFTERSNVSDKLTETYQNLQAAGNKPYLIPYGGSNPTGALGYVNAMLEIAEQGITPDWIVFPSSSAGTQAGMLVGARTSGFQGKILGISVDEPAEKLQNNVADLASRTARFIGEPHTFAVKDVLVNDDYIGEGYAVMGSREVEAIRLFAEYEALLLDPVYTGRAGAGLIDLIRQGFFSSKDTVLFWHTGGGPALFASKYRDMLLDKS